MAVIFFVVMSTSFSISAVQLIPALDVDLLAPFEPYMVPFIV